MNEIIEHPGMAAQTPLAMIPASETTEVGQLIRLAYEKDRDPGELMAVYREALAMKAKREFAEALAHFRGECPPVKRRTPNNQFSVTVDGVKKPRMYASLDDVQSTIDPVLGRLGLSYRWGDAKIENGMMTVACILSHVGGHSEQSAVTVPTESSAGASPAQKWMSAGTYARRYSLVAVTGIKGCEEDDDGQGSGGDTAIDEKISAADARSINDALIEVNANKAAFLKLFGVIGLSDLRQSQLPRVWEAIEKKRKAVAAQ